MPGQRAGRQDARALFLPPAHPDHPPRFGLGHRSRPSTIEFHDGSPFLEGLMLVGPHPADSIHVENIVVQVVHEARQEDKFDPGVGFIALIRASQMLTRLTELARDLG